MARYPKRRSSRSSRSGLNPRQMAMGEIYKGKDGRSYAKNKFGRIEKMW